MLIRLNEPNNMLTLLLFYFWIFLHQVLTNFFWGGGGERWAPRPLPTLRHCRWMIEELWILIFFLVTGFEVSATFSIFIRSSITNDSFEKFSLNFLNLSIGVFSLKAILDFFSQCFASLRHFSSSFDLKAFWSSSKMTSFMVICPFRLFLQHVGKHDGYVRRCRRHTWFSSLARARCLDGILSLSETLQCARAMSINC